MINWNADQRALRAGLTTSCEALSADHVDRTPAESSRRTRGIIKECGVLQLPFDERWGGLGQDLYTTMMSWRASATDARRWPELLGVNAYCQHQILSRPRFGGSQGTLPVRICAGDTIGAHAIPEPDGGSDALAMRTHARRDGSHYVLDGNKTFVSNGAVADLFVVYARTHPDAGPLGLTPFVVERRTPTDSKSATRSPRWDCGHHR